MNLDPTQIQILTKVLNSKGLRYSEAKPDVEIDDDLYNYHLQFLVKKKFLKKEGGLYLLTDKAKTYVHRLDAKGEVYPYFKVSVILFVKREVDGKSEALMHERLREPYIGDVETIAGKVLWGESFEEAAKRKLEEEAGLVAEFKLIGAIRSIRRDVDNKVIEDTIYHTCYAENPKGKLVIENEFGRNMWLDYDSASKGYSNRKVASELSDKVFEDLIIFNNHTSFYIQEEVVVEAF